MRQPRQLTTTKHARRPAGGRRVTIESMLDGSVAEHPAWSRFWLLPRVGDPVTPYATPHANSRRPGSGTGNCVGCHRISAAVRARSSISPSSSRTAEMSRCSSRSSSMWGTRARMASWAAAAPTPARKGFRKSRAWAATRSSIASPLRAFSTAVRAFSAAVMPMLT